MFVAMIVVVGSAGVRLGAQRATTARNATEIRIPASRSLAYNPTMNERPKSDVAVSALKVLVALSLCAVVLATGTVQAQRPVKTNRQAMVRPVVIAPRFIGGKAVESVVINSVVLVFGELAVAEVPATADTPVEQPPKPKQRVILFSGTFDELVYGSDSNAANFQARLDNRLKLKLEEIDRISGLTDAQKQKLQMAGRGDLKRQVERAEKLRVKCDSYTEIADLNQFQKWTEALKSEASAMQHSFSSREPLDADSLLAKCMKTALTAEQVAKYARFAATPPYQAHQPAALFH
jgi:hypothetical protein